MVESVFEITVAMSVIIILIICFSHIIEKRYSAKWRYFVWLFIAIRLAVPLNVTLSNPLINIETPNTSIYVERTVTDNFVNEKNQINENSNKVVEEDSLKTEGNENSALQIPLMKVVEVLWLVGAIAFIGYNFLSYIIFRFRIVRSAKEFEVSILNEVQDEVGIKRVPKIVTSGEILSPMLVGFISPLVILPETQYSENELKVILKHEFMHYKRCDLWYKLLLVISNGIHWFNPIVYLMVKQATRDLEYSCDDAVVKNKSMEYRKNYSMTILKSMESSRATVLSTYLSKSGAREMKRFKNVFNTETKKKGIIAFVCVVAAILTFGGIVAFNGMIVPDEDNAVEFLSPEDKKKYYIDFAMDYRVDFMPNFDEDTYNSDEPVSSVDFLMQTYYMNRDGNLPEDSSLSVELVESVMKDYFGINRVKHESQFKCWTYVPEENKYIPLPQGTAEDELFDVVNFSTYNDGDKKIYDVVLREYGLPFLIGGDYPLSEDEYSVYESYAAENNEFYDVNVKFLLDEMGEEIKGGKSVYKALYELIVSDNTAGLEAGDEIHIKYYIDDESKMPKFIYKQEN